MKTLNRILATLVVMVFATVGFSQTIVGSAHDFTIVPGNVWNTTGKICIVCHTPHNAATIPEAPLWNHEVSAATYILYDVSISPTFDATAAQPDGSSKLCLSCHDGTVALDNFGGVTGGTFFIPTGDDHNLTTDLSDDHPVSFTYNTALATLDGGLYDPSVGTTTLGGTIDSDLLFNGKLQCASCHDVHNGSGQLKLLRIDNAGSSFCLTCHDK